MSDLHPRKEKFRLLTLALAVAVDASSALLTAPYAGTVSGVSYVPNATITGANTNSRTLSVKNRGQAGAGTVAPATLALVTGVNAPAFDEKALTLSATASDLVVAKGDVLSFESIHAGTGLADPGGLVIVEITRS